MTSPQTLFQRTIRMTALVIAGEGMYALPFIVARVFRPTVLDVFGITNLELGLVFSVYGAVAMISYFPGGPLADRFSARRLMASGIVRNGARWNLFRQHSVTQWTPILVRILGAYHDSFILGGAHSGDA